MNIDPTKIQKHIDNIDAQTAANLVSHVADAVVIGSRIIQLLEAAPKGNEIASVREFLHGIRVALDA